MNKAILNPTHRIPVLWSLYRPLIRLSKQYPLIQFEIKQSFRRNQLIRNVPKIRSKLEEGYSLLSDLTKASTGSLYFQTKLSTLQTHLTQLHISSFPTTSPPRPIPSKPKLKPGIIFSTPYNPPLPRLKPQPNHITMLLFNRRKAIQRRWNMFEITKIRIEESREEDRFLERLGVGVGGTEEGDGRLGDEWRVLERSIRESMGRETKRNNMLISPELSNAARQSNIYREKCRNGTIKTRIDDSKSEQTP